MKEQKSNSLVFDLGNSTVSIAFFKGNEIEEPWKIPSQDLLSSLDFQRAIVDSLPFELNDVNIENIYVSSVVATKTDSLIRALYNIFKKEVKVATIDIKNPLIDRRSISNELGVDIFANLIEARVKKPNDDVIVVDFGTALTVSLVNKKGVVKGVSISPGIKSGLRGLFSSANGLQAYDVDLNIPLTVFGEDTETAINAGVFYGTKGMVRELVSEMEKENEGKCYVIATGGHSRLIAPFIGIFNEIDVNHTIKGIRNIFNF